MRLTGRMNGNSADNVKGKTMDCKYITNQLELIRSAAIKAQDDGIKSGDNNTLAWCLDYIEEKIALIRKDMSN
jgi:hypothetical protein